MSSTYSPKVFAHRGSNRFAPESSRPAFDLALTEGADGFETDIQFSKDSIPLLWHDAEMDRIGMPLKAVEQYLWEELELLDISLLSKDFHRFCGLLKLDEFVKLYFKKAPLLLEIKEMKKLDRKSQHKNINIILSCLYAASIEPKEVMISSFDLPVLKFINQNCQENFLVANIRDKEVVEELDTLLSDYPFIKALCFEKSLATCEVIAKVKRLGLKTLIFTCNEEDEIKSALNSEVDIIISDTPGATRKMVNRFLRDK